MSFSCVCTATVKKLSTSQIISEMRIRIHVCILFMYLCMYLNYGGRSFCCAAPSTWNCLPDALKDTDLSLTSFQKQLKTFLLSRY